MNLPKLAAVRDTTESLYRFYLVSTGWTETGSLGHKATTWAPPDIHAFDVQVLLPRQGSVRDYGDRIESVLSTLAKREHRSEDEVFADMVGRDRDLVKVRVTHPDVEQGTIPLNDGVLLHEKARELMVSAALSTISRKRHFSGARPEEATLFLEGLRLGQSEVGSYVVNVLAPLTHNLAAQSVLDSVPFARAVTANLSAALTALRGAISAYKANRDMTAFDSVVEKGVSANMCDAILGICGGATQRDVHLTVVNVPMESSERRVSIEHSFVVDDIQIIKDAAEYFKDNYVLLDRLVSGYVKRLDRVPEANEGVATVLALLSNGQEKNVAIELVASDYLLAIHAHEQKLLVRCRGDVHVSPRAAKLLNPSEFEIVQPEKLI